MTSVPTHPQATLAAKRARKVTLVALVGTRAVYGFRQGIMGKL
jgi:urease beta subunit